MPPMPSYSRKPPGSVSHSRGSPASAFSCSLGLMAGREKGREEGDKLVAWPLSHLLLAAFQELQIPPPKLGHY